MYVLRIEHDVPDYDRWKQAFDSDPLARERSGVRRHTVLRPVDDPEHVLVDLEFETEEEAEVFHARLLEMWERVDVMRNPRARTVEAVERTEAPPRA